MLYNDQDYIQTLIDSVVENVADGNTSYNRKKLASALRKEIFLAYTILPIVCMISQIWSLRILISSKMQKPKHGQRVCVAVLMAVSGTLCFYVILKYALLLQQDCLGLYAVFKFFPPGVALITTAGHLYVYFYMFQKISTKQIDDTILRGVQVHSVSRKNKKSFSNGVGEFDVTSQLLSPDMTHPTGGMPLAGMTQMDPQFLIKQQQQMQHAAMQQQQKEQQRAMADTKKRGQAQFATQNPDDHWGSVKQEPNGAFR